MDQDPKYRERFREMVEVIKKQEEERKRKLVELIREGRGSETIDKDTAPRPFQYQVWFEMPVAHNTLNEVMAHPCGTEWCLGGYGAIRQMIEEGMGEGIIETEGSRIENTYYYVVTGEETIKLSIDQTWGKAREWWGIDQEEARHLFYGGWHSDSTLAKVEDIVAKLERVAESGIVIDEEFDAKYK